LSEIEAQVSHAKESGRFGSQTGRFPFVLKNLVDFFWIEDYYLELWSADSRLLTKR